MCKNSTLNVKIDAICEKITLNVKKMRLSKCIKHFDSKCVKIDATCICANLILTLFVKTFGNSMRYISLLKQRPF